MIKRKRSRAESAMLICASFIPMVLVFTIYYIKLLRNWTALSLRYLVLVPGFFVGRAVFRRLSTQEPEHLNDSADYDEGMVHGPIDLGSIEWSALIPAVIIGLTVCIALRLLLTHEMVRALDQMESNYGSEDN